MNDVRVILWDGESLAPNNERNEKQLTVYWKRFCAPDEKNAISIPQLIEENAENLRSRYLAMVYEIGEESLQCERVIDCLAYRPGFSFWWMTLLTEKSNFARSPRINDLIRLMAFEDWLASQKVACIDLFTQDALLSSSIQSLCEQKNLTFQSEQQRSNSASSTVLKRIFEKLPYGVQAVVWLGYYVVGRWCLRGVGLRGWCNSTARKTFIGYSDNCVSDSAARGQYASHYWGNLPAVLENASCESNWLHLYVKDSVMPTPNEAAKVIGRFNDAALQNHVTLDSFLSLRVILATLRDFSTLIFKGRACLQRAQQWGRKNGPYWVLLRDDCRASLYGKTAVEGLLFHNLFASAFSMLPSQLVGVFLQENQSWEAGCVQAWRDAGHNRSVAVPHSTVRFWDLRYHSDKRTYESGLNPMPRPDVVACNGPVAKASLVNSGYPEEEIVDVEALRYLYLDQVESAGDLSHETVDLGVGSAIRLLVLGDYLYSSTHRQLCLLNDAAGYFSMDVEMTVKPHPNCPIHPEDYPNLSMTVTSDSIARLLGMHDVAYTGMLTSAAVDAYTAGLPVISLLDPGMLNLSPLRGCKGVWFVSAPDELAMALQATANFSAEPIDKVEYFYLDSHLPRWKRLLLESAE